MPAKSSTAAGAVPYAPSDVRSAYGVSTLYNSGLTGSGQTIGVVTLAPFDLNDIRAFEAAYGLSQSTLVTAVPTGTGPYGCSTSGNDETTLDVEWSSSMAPNAAIKVFEGPDPCLQSLYDAMSAAVGDSNVSVITVSWGLCESSTSASFKDALDTLMARGAAAGKSIFVASGDDGSDDCQTGNSPPAVDFPASSPHVTAAGGTTLRLIQPSSQIGSEVAWSGSGGGCSGYFPTPSWQAGTGCASRALPDIAANADPTTGYSVYYSGRFWQFGGTSVAAPVWAGIMADINQGRASQGLPGEGLANADLYGAAAMNHAFQDITTGGNGAFSARAGWDAVTGWGSPNAVLLARSLGAIRSTLTANTTSLLPGAAVTASWANLTSPAADDWLGLFPIGASDSAYTSWSWVNCTATSGSFTVPFPSGSCPYSTPSSAGSYEFRLFAHNSFTRLLTSPAFTVT